MPSAGRLLAEDGNWLTVRPEVRRGLHRLTQGLAALPAAQLPGFPTADTGVTSPRPTSGSDLPVVPLVAVVVLLAVIGLVVRRLVVGSGPSRALRSAE